MRTRELIPTMPSKRRYGITESKKAELDMLTRQVIDAQLELEQQQAIVNSLTAKSTQFNAYLVTAGNNKSHALANKEQVIQLVQSATDLLGNSKTAFSASVKADSKTQELATVMKDLIDKLIFSAEVVNKLANVIIRKKALNPLISDDLVKMAAIAGADANTAVSLTLIALQSAFTSQASSLETESASVLEYIESINLYKTLTGKVEELSGGPEKLQFPESSGAFEFVKIYKEFEGVSIRFVDGPDTNKSLLALLSKAYDMAVADYNEALVSNNATTAQLAVATSNLIKAQNNLSSLQAGLAAANAAALAS